jgi:hypothetical protein
MATLNLRNESNKFVKLQDDSFIHKPSGETEDVTVELTGVNSDKIFNAYSDEDCGVFVGTFKVLFRNNDGVYLSITNLSGNKLKGDVDFASNIEIMDGGEEKLLDWSDLNDSKIFNVTLANA